jgi:hypothetical protein
MRGKTTETLRHRERERPCYLSWQQSLTLLVNLVEAEIP